jgi:hypothetical protein
MASKSLIFSVGGADAPFNFKVEIIAPCVDITITRGGVSGINTLSFSSNSPSETVVLSWNDVNCVQDLIGIVQVTAEGATCSIVKTYELTNICKGSSVSLHSGLVNLGQQTIGSSVNSMAIGPLSYAWSVSAGAVIVGSSTGAQVQLARSGDQVTVTLVVTDSNGCKKTGTLVLPQLNSAPTASNHMVIRSCANAVTVPLVIDVVPLVGDIDGDLDWTSVAINTNPTQGAAVYSSVNKTITYTGDVGAAGFDGFTFLIYDTNGTPSNVATVTIQLDPCSEAPVGVADTATAECGETIFIPILANDTSTIPFNPASVVIITAPFHGTAIVLSNGTIQYTPDDNYSGSDFIRYKVADANGGFTEITLVEITVETCCQSNAWLSIGCQGDGSELDGYRLVATGTGSYTGSGTSTIEKSTNGIAYAGGNEHFIVNNCVTPLNTTFPNIALGGDAEIELGTVLMGMRKITVAFDSALTIEALIELQAFMSGCTGQMFIFKNGTDEYRFLRNGMSNILVTVNEVSWDHIGTIGLGVCQSTMNAAVGDTNALLVIGADIPLNDANPLQIICRDYYPITSVWFRRTIERVGCPDVVITLKVSYRPSPLPVCGQPDYTVEVLSGELTEAPEVVYSYDFDETGVSSIISITSDLGVTSAAYPLPAGLTDFVQFVNDLMIGSGGGTFNAVYAGDRLICQVRNSPIEWASILTNAGTGNFVAI